MDFILSLIEVLSSEFRSEKRGTRDAIGRELVGYDEAKIAVKGNICLLKGFGCNICIHQKKKDVL